MTGADRISFHAQRTGWAEHDRGAAVVTYTRGDEYTLVVYTTLTGAVARACLRRASDAARFARPRWISGGSARADRVMAWMNDPEAVFP